MDQQDCVCACVRVFVYIWLAGDGRSLLRLKMGCIICERFIIKWDQFLGQNIASCIRSMHGSCLSNKCQMYWPIHPRLQACMPCFPIVQHEPLFLSLPKNYLVILVQEMFPFVSSRRRIRSHPVLSYFHILRHLNSIFCFG